MTVKEFVKLANGCKTKAELASLAKQNGVKLNKEELDKLYKKIVSDGQEISEDMLENAAGGAGGAGAYGNEFKPNVL